MNAPLPKADRGMQQDPADRNVVHASTQGTRHYLLRLSLGYSDSDMNPMHTCLLTLVCVCDMNPCLCKVLVCHHNSLYCLNEKSLV